MTLGCGTAYVSAWLARRGARPVGVDVTPAQLATARRCQTEFAIDFPLVEYSGAFSAEWSRKWPSEEIWVAQRPR